MRDSHARARLAEAERLLTEAPPAEAAAELEKMIDGFQSGAGAATGRRTEPAATDPPTENLPDAGDT